MVKNTEFISITLDSDQYKQLEQHFAEKEKAKMRSTDWRVSIDTKL